MTSLKIVEMFCYLGVTIRARRSAFDSVIIRFRCGWCKFRGLVPLLASNVIYILVSRPRSQIYNLFKKTTIIQQKKCSKIIALNQI